MCTVQDLEVQNNELVEANEKLQKELGMLRSLAKEAIVEKKKSQAALEALKHQVVHLLGEHNMVPKQETLQQEPAAQPATGRSLSRSLCPQNRKVNSQLARSAWLLGQISFQ